MKISTMKSNAQVADIAGVVKPLYQIPTIAEIQKIPFNGFEVVSTFSGAGGSSLGYRMAGFKILWANEFIPAAQEVYRANFPNTFLDKRDIRIVKPEEILKTIGMKRGELDLLDGSPPCASFSTAGNRNRDWGKIKKYSDTQQRTDDLFFEYVRILDGLQPKVFLAENVSGLVKGVAKGYFLMILAALKGCGYRVKAKLLDAQWLGVPQKRQRIIFIGVRNDLEIYPQFPKPFPYRYSIKDAIPWAITVRYGGGFGNELWTSADTLPTDTVGSQPSRGNNINNNNFKIEVEADISRFAIGKEWDNLKPGEKSKKYINLIKPSWEHPCNTITTPSGLISAATVVHPTEKRRFSITELKRICAFPEDFILTGTYAQQWERLGRSVPPLMMRVIARVIRDKILMRLKDGTR